MFFATAIPTSWKCNQFQTNAKAVFSAVAWLFFFSFACSAMAEPRISGLSRTSGEVGTSVTISGTGFGTLQGSSVVRFGNVTATTTRWSDTEIVVPVPIKATTGNITVTVRGVTSHPEPFAVGPTLLQIASPSSGDIVNQRQVMPVSISSPANVSFTQVAVIGENPIGVSNIGTSVPTQVSVAIPTDVAANTYMLTAVGTTASGQAVFSDPVLIDVERPDRPVSIAATTPTLFFESLGDELPLTLLGTFADGSVLDVTHSSHVLYTTSNRAIAGVNTQGIVTAIAPGTTVVTATYTLNGKSVRAYINSRLSKATPE